MKEKINYFLQKKIQDYIRENLNANTDKILFSKNKENLDIKLIVEQIQARKKAQKKVPSWSNNSEIFYISLSLEQATNEILAEIKSEFFEGKTCLDLTGGMGIDSFFLATSFEKVYYVEQSPDVFEVTKHNFQVLETKNITCYNIDALSFLESYQEKADLIYLDPARRNSAKEKVYFLEDYEPNVLNLLDILLEKSKQIFIKTSPMLDIQKAIQDLKYVQKVYILSLQNEVKEVSYLLGKEKQEIIYKCIEVSNTKTKKHINFQKKSIQKVNYSLAKKYLYEPFASALKAQVFNSIAQYYKLEKLHPNSHLYTSDNLKQNFFGRSFEVLAKTKLSKKEVLAYLPKRKANITTRNFPLSVKEIRKKLNVKDGGEIYLFATTDIQENKIILICKKI